MLLQEYSVGFVGRFSGYSPQCLARQWIHVLRQYLAPLDDLHTFSTVKWTRSLNLFFSVLTQNGEVCSVDASVFSLVAQLALGKLDTTFTSFAWLRRMMMDSIFHRLARHFSASSSEIRPSVSGLPMNLDDLWPYTSHLRARVRNNIKTIWNTSPHPMAGPLVVGGESGSVASQVPTLVGDLAGEAESQPEPCTERHWPTLLHLLGHVPYTTVAASPRSSAFWLRAFSGHEPMQYLEASSRPGPTCGSRRIILDVMLPAGPGAGVRPREVQMLVGSLWRWRRWEEGRYDVVDVFL